MREKVRFHDGYVLGMMLDGKRVIVTLSQEDGTLYSLELLDVTHFYANDFQVGNIIFGLDIVDLAEQSLDQVKLCLRDLYDEAEISDLLAKELMAQRQVFVSVDPTWGCYLTALCGDVRLSKVV